MSLRMLRQSHAQEGVERLDRLVAHPICLT